MRNLSRKFAVFLLLGLVLISATPHISHAAIITETQRSSFLLLLRAFGVAESVVAQIEQQITGANQLQTQTPTVAQTQPQGGTPTDQTAQWTKGVTLLGGFRNMYNGDVVRVANDPYPYKMWFFGWAVGPNCNPGYSGCDAIFFARSVDGVNWEVYAGRGANGAAVFDDTETPSTWVPVITAGSSYFDSVHNGDPSVVYVDGTYYMAFTASGSNEFTDIMGATSRDGITWQKSTAPILVYTDQATNTHPVEYGDYARPALLYEDGRFKLWFDYWISESGMSMGYAERVVSAPSPTNFLQPFTVVRAGTQPDIRTWPNPDVVHYGDLYYSYANPPQTYDEDDGGTWRGQKITEATSPDGVHWTVTGYINSEADCAATHTPQAYVEGGVMYVTYGCQIGGSPYDFRYKEIRRMAKSLTGATIPTVAKRVIQQAPPAAPTGQLSVSGCTLSSGRGTCPVSVRWNNVARSLYSGAPFIALNVIDTATNSFYGGAPVLGTSYYQSQAVSGSYTFELPRGTYNIALYGWYNQAYSLINLKQVTVTSAQGAAAIEAINQSQPPLSEPTPVLIFARILSRGMSGADVTALQIALVGKRYLQVPATGYYGPLTEAAVSAYQKDHHIEQTGVFGHETINALLGL